MVLMAVCNDDGPYLILALKHIVHVGDDDVDAQHVAFGEHQAAVDDQQFLVVLKDHHVFPDLTDAAEGDNA